VAGDGRILPAGRRPDARQGRDEGSIGEEVGMTQTVFLIDRTRCLYAKSLIDKAPPDHVMQIKPMTRTLDQNSKLWPMLNEVSQQVEWHGSFRSPHAWKQMFLSALIDADFIPGIEGEPVNVSNRSSTLSKERFSELIELIYAFGANHGVVFSDVMPKGYDDGNR